MDGARLSLFAVPGLPEIRPGDDLAALVLDRLAGDDALASGDVIVFAQKAVSKAEGRVVELAAVTPSPPAQALADQSGKDPRIVELILAESRRIVRARVGVIIAEHRLGFIMANAGIDQSNSGGGDRAVLLPLDPDASAARLRNEIRRRSGRAVGVVISDSFGRPWRLGTCGVAIGAAGIAAMIDRRGSPDRDDRPLAATTVGHADEIAAAASLVMGQADEGRPVVVVRGLAPAGPEAKAAALVRAADEDLFR
jgi:coenzyme F420-0:L-glutamate ligase / coenzyme F420-1:gamma-L-glutamate ligase